MFQLPLEKSAGVISAVSNAITHPIGQATLAAAPIAAAAIPVIAQHNAEKKQEQQAKQAIKSATVGLAPTTIGRFKAPLPPVQIGHNVPDTSLLGRVLGRQKTRVVTTNPAVMNSAFDDAAPHVSGMTLADRTSDNFLNTPPGLRPDIHTPAINAEVHRIHGDWLGRALWESRPHPDALRHNLAVQEMNRPKQAIAPLLAGAASALARPGVQAAMNIAPFAMALAPSRPPTPSPSPAQNPKASPNQAQPSTAFSTTTKQSSVATTPEGVIDNRQVVAPPTPTPGPTGNAVPGKANDGISPGVPSTSKPKSSTPKTTTSPGAPKAFKMAWYLPFQNTVKDFVNGAFDAADQEAGKLLTPTDTLDPVKTRTPTLGNII